MGDYSEVCDLAAGNGCNPGVDFYVVIVLVVMSALIAFAAGQYFRRRQQPVALGLSAGTQTIPIGSTTVASQAQTTYKWKWQQPRFVPLPAASHG